jgi:hypothetical protein
MYATAQQAAILRAAVEAIKQHPETFDMSQWACGTTWCLAGQIVRNDSDDDEWSSLVALEARRLAHMSKGETQFPIRDRALAVLNADGSVEDKLFYVDNWPDQFRPAVSDFTELYEPATPAQLEARVEWWIATGE